MENPIYIATANRACSLLYSYIKEHSSRLWLLPVNVCPDVPLTFCLAQVSFKFIDIDPKTLCIDLDEVEKIIHQSPPGSIGLLYVRTYGVLNDIKSEFSRIKSIKKDILIIDDRCLCMPTCNPDFEGADMLLYSTGHCKQIDLNGGGFAFYNADVEYHIDEALLYNGTDEEVLYKKAFDEGCPLNNVPTGWLKQDYFEPFSEYFKKIKDKIPEREAQRTVINSIYSKNLPSEIQLRPEYQTWRFNIVVDSSVKDAILTNLFHNNLFASTHYHCVNRLFDSQIFLESDLLYSRVINLFNDKYYTEEKAIKTCEIINSII